MWDEEKLGADLTKLMVTARDYMNVGIEKFGFVSEIVSTEDI